MRTVVLCLEGCHGSGKTALTAEFRALGFTVMDEGFLSQPPTLVHPQSLLMETAWVCGWFQRVMSHIVSTRKDSAGAAGTAEPASPRDTQVIIADRSPLSAVFYSRSDGHLLEPLIRQYVAELKAAADVHIVTVHLRTQRELLWSRIQSRLLLEPERAALREDQAEWMDAVLAFYDRMTWDVTVANDEASLATLIAMLFTRLAELDDVIGPTIATSPLVARHLAGDKECAAGYTTPVKATRSLSAGAGDLAGSLSVGAGSGSTESDSEGEVTAGAGASGAASPASMKSAERAADPIALHASPAVAPAGADGGSAGAAGTAVAPAMGLAMV